MRWPPPRPPSLLSTPARAPSGRAHFAPARLRSSNAKNLTGCLSVRRLCRSTAAAAITPTRARRPAQLRQRNQRRQTNSSPGGQPVSDQRQYRSVLATTPAIHGRADHVAQRGGLTSSCHKCASCAQRTPFNPVGNINMQPGLGIIPTLFGLQHGQGAFVARQRRASAHSMIMLYWRTCLMNEATA